jgi:hypothetical protein
MKATVKRRVEFEPVEVRLRIESRAELEELYIRIIIPSSEINDASVKGWSKDQEINRIQNKGIEQTKGVRIVGDLIKKYII